MSSIGLFFAAVRRGLCGAACHDGGMQLSIEAYQALKSEMVDHRASIGLLIRVVREQANEIAWLRKQVPAGAESDLNHTEVQAPHPS